MVRIAHQTCVVAGAGSVEPAACEADTVGGGGGEGGGDIEAGLGAKNNPSRVHQKQVGVTVADLDQTVDDGGIATNNSTEDVANLGLSQEVGDFAGFEAQFLEAVEQVLTVVRETAAANVELLAVEGDNCAGAVGSGSNGLCPQGLNANCAC